MTARPNISLANYFEILIIFCFICLYPNTSARISDLDMMDLDATFVMKKIEARKSDYCPQLMMSGDLWQYLRKGLNYLESSGRDCPPDFVHPGGVAFGPLGLSRIAVEDVFERFPSMRGFKAEEVFKDPKAYESFAMCYADLLLRHYLRIDYWDMPAQEVFDVLQKAWFLGPTIYKDGGQIIASRQIRAKEFILSNNKLAM